MNQENLYQCKSKPIPGRDYSDVYRTARKIYNEIKNNTKRRPYLKSAYFKGDKVFFDNFWPHLNQKNPRDRKRRLKYFECAMELIEKSKFQPYFQKKHPDKNEVLYRFQGASNQQCFMIQIKHDIKRGQKFLMSIFEFNKQK